LKGKKMKVSIKKTEVYASMMGGGSAGKPVRQASISDTYGMGKPTRTNPVGGFMPMMCFGGATRKSRPPRRVLQGSKRGFTNG
jgi:hypothetical protein